MWQYLVYFLVGGMLVALVAYLGSRGNGMLAAFVASMPILFLLNVLLIYRSGGAAATVTCARGYLLFLPAFACYATLTIWLLPRLGIPKALLPGLLIYLVPVMTRKLLRPKVSKTTGLSTEATEEVNE